MSGNEVHVWDLTYHLVIYICLNKACHWLISDFKWFRFFLQERSISHSWSRLVSLFLFRHLQCVEKSFSGFLKRVMNLWLLLPCRTLPYPISARRGSTTCLGKPIAAFLKTSFQSLWKLLKNRHSYLFLWVYSLDSYCWGASQVLPRCKYQKTHPRAYSFTPPNLSFLHQYGFSLFECLIGDTFAEFSPYRHQASN